MHAHRHCMHRWTWCMTGLWPPTSVTQWSKPRWWIVVRLLSLLTIASWSTAWARWDCRASLCPGWLHSSKAASKGRELGWHLSVWVPVHARVPQGTRVGLIVFFFMVNDLFKDQRWVKFVDDTASWKCYYVTGRDSHLQAVATDPASWSDCSGMQLNADKTKEFIVSFCKSILLRTFHHLSLVERN